jgi:hypothetical protein
VSFDDEWAPALAAKARLYEAGVNQVVMDMVDVKLRSIFEAWHMAGRFYLPYQTLTCYLLSNCAGNNDTTNRREATAHAVQAAFFQITIRCTGPAVEQRSRQGKLKAQPSHPVWSRGSAVTGRPRVGSQSPLTSLLSVHHRQSRMIAPQYYCVASSFFTRCHISCSIHRLDFLPRG